MTVELENQGNNKAPAYLTTPDFFARLQRDSATQLSIQNYKGTVVEVNAERVAVGSAGFTLLNTANLISAAGADSGGAPAINTLYYCYVSNSQASFAPLGIRMSATAPSLFNGVKYLAAAGNGANWRFVGWVRTISNAGTVNFADTAGGGLTAGQRLVVNYYNRLVGQINIICPNYVDDNAFTSYTLVTGAAANWAAVSGNVQSSFISNGEDSVDIAVLALFACPVNAFVGVGLDSTTDPTITVNVASSSTRSSSIVKQVLAAEGYRTLDLLWSIFAAGTLTVFSDVPRLGAAVDPMATGYSATVMV